MKGTVRNGRELYKSLCGQVWVLSSSLQMKGMADQIPGMLDCGLQELKRNVQREYAKLLTVIQAYAVISTGVRLICTNQVGILFSCNHDTLEVFRAQHILTAALPGHECALSRAEH